MSFTTHVLTALFMSLCLASVATAQATEPANTKNIDWTEAQIKALPGKGPYLYKDCITPFSGHWVPTLPFRSTYSTAEELMANTNFEQCVKFGWSSYHQFES